MAKKTRISDKNYTSDLNKSGELPPKSGLFHSIVECGNIASPSGRVKFIKAQNETVLTSNGAWVVLGTDRPNSLRSGYGASGGCKAASIDLVVGRLATARKGKGPKQSKGKYAFVNPDFSADAARIYISQMTDIDHNFGIAQGNAPQSKARSGIGIKADAVRIIGRESIRLVWGGLFNPRERIRGLQGVCLGANTRDAIMELAENVNTCMGAIISIAQIQQEVCMILGVTSPVMLGGVMALETLRSMLQGSVSLYHIRAELVTYQINYLTPAGYKCIWSRNVKAT